MKNIVRKQNGSFTVIRNALVNDERLSLEAIGLLTWLLSKPDNWKVIQSHIASVFKLGRDKVRKLVNELIDCGYLVKSIVRAEDGEFSGVNYVLYDVPPETDFPASDNPASVLPTADNQALVNTESKQELRSSLTSDVGRAVDDWNAFAQEHNLAQVQKLTAKRRKHLAARLADCGGIDGFNACLAKISNSPFLLGQQSDWRCNFDFVVSESGFTKIMEGKYDARLAARQGKHPSPSDTLAEMRNRIAEERSRLDGVGHGFG